MKRNPAFILFIILMLFCGSNRLYSQDIGNTISSSHFRSIIENTYGPDPRLVSGKLYRGARQGSVAGHPYYIDENWKTGYVIIDSLYFDSLLLKYDVLENKLVLNTSNISNSNVSLCLNINNISRFSIDGHNFIPFPPEKDRPDRRFSEAVVEGDLSHLILKRKVLGIDGTGVDYSYKTHENQYLLFNNELIRFRSKRTFFKLFPAFKNELKKYIRQKNLILLRKNPENLKKLTEYCNTLLNNTQ